MTTRTLPFLLVVSALGACGSATAGSINENGQTGSIGQPECTEDAQCVESVQNWLSEYEVPLTYVPEFDHASCEQIEIIAGDDSARGLACNCAIAGGSGSLTAGPAGAACSHVGRTDCVYAGSDFPGCDPGDPQSCNAVCADLQSRVQADAMRTYQTEVRSARCQDFHCLSVVRIGDHCYPGPQPDTFEPYDCSWSDQKILDAAGHSSSTSP